MQIFSKVFLIVFIIKIINCELKTCDNENIDCNIDEIKLSALNITDLSSFVKYVTKYFNDLYHKYENKVNAIANDIDYIKSTFHSKSGENASCENSLNQLTKTKATNTTTGAPPTSIYDNIWVIIQRRQEGAVNFYRSWVHYIVGFGNPFREFFIGLDKLHYLTNSRPHELLIKVEDFKGNLTYALYDEFLIGNESEKYQLKKLGNYTGNAGDYLRIHEGMYFSTRDRDNDASDNLHCAKLYQGGWWYNNCMTSNLNGPFRTRYEVHNVNITWGKRNATQIKFVQMMIRSKR